MNDIQRIAGYAEQAAANDQWWYRLGYAAGYADATWQAGDE